MIPFYLVTGFLGSGKTTFLKNVLNTWGEEYRIAIIQNEFAPTGVDGKLLKENSPGFQLVEINNGSVFCACQLSNFIETLETIVARYQPRLMFLEASGLADPINIAEILQSEKISKELRLQHIYCIADAQNYFKGLNAITRFKHQLMVADTILLNKCDLTEDEEKQAIVNSIRGKNPFAEIIETTYSQFSFVPDQNLPLKERASTGKASAGRPDMNAAVLRNNEKINEEQLPNFINELNKTCIRVKGIFHTKGGTALAVQSVYGEWTTRQIKAIPGPNELIVFGEMTPRKLRELFQQVFGQSKS